MKEIVWLENILKPLEESAKEILKSQPLFLPKELGPGRTRYRQNPSRQAPKELLDEAKHLREAIRKGDMRGLFLHIRE